MRNKILYTFWIVLFILCGLMGFIPEPTGFAKVLLVILGLIFFLPGAALLYFAGQEKNLFVIRLIRNVSLISLGMTLVLLVACFLSAGADEASAALLYGFMIFLSSPMVCMQYWAVSLFLWACLLMTSLSLLKKYR